MVFIDLDAYEMINKEHTHEYIARMLRIADENNNLDVLFNTLKGIDYEVIIRLKNSQVIERNLGNYGIRLIETMNLASQQNPKLHMRLIWQNGVYNG